MTVAKIETLEQNTIGRHLYPSLGFREIARQIHYAMSLIPDAQTSPITTDRPGLLDIFSRANVTRL